MAVVNVCDKCSEVIGEGKGSFSPMEIKEGFAELVIRCDETAELCEKCKRKEMLNVANKAMDRLRTKRPRKKKEEGGEEG